MSPVAAYLSLHMRRNLPYTSFAPLRQIASAESINQMSQFQQVHNAEQRPLFTQDDLGIWSDNVRPLRRNRANAVIVNLQQQSHPITVVPLAHTSQLPSAERVERMRDAHKTHRCDRSICILG